MNDNKIQFEFLKFLQEVGITKERNVSEFIAKRFEPSQNIQERVLTEYDKGVKFLRSLKNKQYVDFDEGALSNIGTTYRSASPVPVGELPLWFDSIPINGSITFNGLDYLNQHELNENIKNANNTIATNSGKQTEILEGQKKYLYITALLTLANVLITVINLNSGDLKDKQQILIQEQSKQIHTLQIELSQALNSIPRALKVKIDTTKKMH